MTKQEVATLIALNKSNYPAAYKNINKEETTALAKTWYGVLGNYNSQLISYAFTNALTKCEFPVTLADIFKEIRKMEKATQPSDGEIWEQFLDGCNKIRKAAGYDPYRGEIVVAETRRVFESLPPVIKEFAGNANAMLTYYFMEDNELLQFVKPRFLKSLPEIKERAKFLESTPPEILTLINGNVFKSIDYNGRLLEASEN